MISKNKKRRKGRKEKKDKNENENIDTYFTMKYDKIKYNKRS